MPECESVFKFSINLYNIFFTFLNTIYINMKTIKNKTIKHKTIKSKTRQSKLKSKTKKQFLYNPNDPNKSFDVYIDKNPKDTINIKYTTLQDVKNTINKLETLYKHKKYTHKRIWQVAMIMKVRLEVLKEKKPKQYNLAKKYFEFLGKRTNLNEAERYKYIFT